MYKTITIKYDSQLLLFFATVNHNQLWTESAPTLVEALGNTLLSYSGELGITIVNK